MTTKELNIKDPSGCWATLQAVSDYSPYSAELIMSLAEIAGKNNPSFNRIQIVSVVEARRIFSKELRDRVVLRGQRIDADAEKRKSIAREFSQLYFAETIEQKIAACIEGELLLWELAKSTASDPGLDHSTSDLLYRFSQHVEFSLTLLVRAFPSSKRKAI